MLVISRKRNQSVDCYIDGELVMSVMVTDIHRGQVRLGLQADERVVFVRGEKDVDAREPELGGEG